MEIVIQQLIILKDKREFRDVSKTYQSNVIPHKGDFITDTAFKDPYEYEVLEVTIDYKNNECYVRLPIITLESNDKSLLKQYIEMYELHDWKNNIPID